MNQSKVVAMRPRWQRKMNSLWQTAWQTTVERIQERILAKKRPPDRRSPSGDQTRERRLKTGQMFRTDGTIDELIMDNGYILRTLNLNNTLTISLVDKHGKDLDFDCCDTIWPSDEIVKYKFGEGGAFEIGPKLRTLYMPGGEKILLDQIGILAVLKGDDIEQMRRRSASTRTSNRQLATV
jgi:hypothetical protein